MKYKALKIDSQRIMETQAAQIQKKIQVELDSFKSSQKGEKHENCKKISQMLKFSLITL